VFDLVCYLVDGDVAGHFARLANSSVGDIVRDIVGDIVGDMVANIVVDGAGMGTFRVITLGVGGVLASAWQAYVAYQLCRCWTRFGWVGFGAFARCSYRKS